MALNYIHFWVLGFALLANVALTIYILARRLKSIASLYYFIFMLAVVLHIAGDLFFQLSADMWSAFFWIIMYWAGFFFIAHFFFLFTTAYPRNRLLIFNSEQAKHWLILIPISLLYILVNSSDYVKSIILSPTGINTVEYGSLYVLGVGYIALFLGVGFIGLYKEYRAAPLASEKRRIGWVLTGYFLAGAFGWICDVFLLKLLGFGELKVASFFILISAFTMSYAVIGHKVFAIEPITEGSVASRPLIDTQAGKTYSYVEKSKVRRKAFRLFADHVRHNRQGLVISTIYPEQVRKTYNLQKTPVLWLSESSGVEKERVSPREIDTLLRSINQFLDKAKNPAILIEGIKSLIIENGIEKTRIFLEAVAKDVKEKGVVLFISLSEDESEFYELMKSTGTAKKNGEDLKKQLFSNKISEDTYKELAAEVEGRIIDAEARMKLVEEKMLGQAIGISDKERQKIILDNKLNIVKYKIAKRLLDEKVGSELLKDVEKKIFELNEENEEKE
jgi:hypothetical protein